MLARFALVAPLQRNDPGAPRQAPDGNAGPGGGGRIQPPPARSTGTCTSKRLRNQGVNGPFQNTA